MNSVHINNSNITKEVLQHESLRPLVEISTAVMAQSGRRRDGSSIAKRFPFLCISSCAIIILYLHKYVNTPKASEHNLRVEMPPREPVRRVHGGFELSENLMVKTRAMQNK